MQTPIAGNQPGEFRPDSSLPQEAYALLAQANLLRIRGQWHEAIEKCILAMKLSPQNPAAQSLLGDIYENQGFIDDAIQWYRMALDTKPDSIADEKKLQRLLREKKTIEQSAVGVKTLRAAPPETTDEITLQPGPTRDPAKALRIATFISVLFVVAIMLLDLVYSHAHTGAATPKNVDTAPIVLTDPFSPETTPSSPSLAPAPNLPRDPQDQAFFDTLSSSPSMSLPNTTLTDAQSDQRTGRMTLTIMLTLDQSVTVTRDMVMRYSLQALQAASRTAAASTSYSGYTIRTMVTRKGSSASDTPVMFIADTSSADLIALTGPISSLTPSQLQAILANQWWSATVGQ